LLRVFRVFFVPGVVAVFFFFFVGANGPRSGRTDKQTGARVEFGGVAAAKELEAPPTHTERVGIGRGSLGARQIKRGGVEAVLCAGLFMCGES